VLIWAVTPEESAMLEQWAVDRIPYMRDGSFGPCMCGGVVRNSALRAVVVFSDWQQDYRTLQVSIASDGPGWATRDVLREMFRYAFLTAGANLLWSSMRADNSAAIEFNRRLGFRRDAVLRHRYGPGQHAVITSMTRGAWRRSKWR
jgi:hypothetical protein